ncbi:MAG: SIMPL domain-containing protein [Halanaerobium sp.]
MNKNFGMFLVFLALILLSVLVVNGLYFDASEEQVQAPAEVAEEEVEEDEKDHITTNLSISREKEYEPDIVDVVLGFQNENEDQDEAVKENSQTVENLMAVLEEKDLVDLETQYYRVYPVTRYNDDNEKETYYRVTNQIKFTTENLEELPVLLGQLLQAGANNVEDINYRLKDNEEALDEVTAMALSSLKDKAAFVADNLDKEDYRIVNVNLGRQNIRSESFDSAFMGSRAAESESIPVPVEEEKVNINVSLSAEIELY